MAYTVAEQAVQDLISTLPSITRAAGYNFDAFVEEKAKEGNVPTEGKCVVEAMDAGFREGQTPVMFQEVDQYVSITCYHLPRNADPTRLTEVLSQMAGDIRKCLMVDYHRSGLAINTEFPQKDQYQTESPPYFVRVVANLWVRHRYGNPYSQT